MALQQVLHILLISLQALFIANQRATGAQVSLRELIVTTATRSTMIHVRDVFIRHRVERRSHACHNIIPFKQLAGIRQAMFLLSDDGTDIHQL